ncbi:MAG: BlaI/MecI/CopY family transcriptional regulator [Acidimicrobiia bacterium]|nr:BlaI/MecI/CopY family transcriptional regulator [Acidimicrobiia bacterium]
MARPKTKPGEERLSPSEWEIMRICWKLGRANVRQILKEDLKKKTRDYRTILTFVSRMAAKGFLKVEKEGNTNYYTAALPQKKGLQREIDRFLKEVVGPERENLELVRQATNRKLSRKSRKPRRKTRA